MKLKKTKYISFKIYKIKRSLGEKGVIWKKKHLKTHVWLAARLKLCMLCFPDLLIFYALDYAVYYCLYQILCPPIFKFLFTFLLLHSYFLFLMYLLHVNTLKTILHMKLYKCFFTSLCICNKKYSDVTTLYINFFSVTT